MIQSAVVTNGVGIVFTDCPSALGQVWRSSTSATAVPPQVIHPDSKAYPPVLS